MFNYDKDVVDTISVKGIGKKLMESAEKYAKKLGKSVFTFLEVLRIFNARIFYAKLGFGVVGKT